MERKKEWIKNGKKERKKERTVKVNGWKNDSKQEKKKTWNTEITFSHWEMCKKFKFDHTNKWCMHNPSPVRENDTYKLLWDFDIHTDHLISARKQDLIIINEKENMQNCRLCCPGRPHNRIERMWKEG